MKNIIILFAAAVLLTSCQNASTVFALRSIIHVSTPELAGAKASVSNSPTSDKNTVQADKEFPINAAETQTINQPAEDPAKVEK